MVLKNNVDVFKFQPHGRLDLEGGRRLQDQVCGIIAEPHGFWVIDMSQIEFVDSAGLVALVKSMNSATTVGARLAICNLRPSTRLIFEITRLDRVFPIFETYEAALTYFSHPESVEAREFALDVA
jgi:anti-sigma B factor antagonist